MDCKKEDFTLKTNAGPEIGVILPRPYIEQIIGFKSIISVLFLKNEKP